ncbi:chlorophyllase [Amycolatopsis sp. WAC 04197]|uniref:alpha/beta hydrolase family protein n=1 Tax=Amycolatopsis sp. WAC 04197 TaxID=2203199 RepID=UPI000F779D50|nr:alpha/beta fold hydrolase [Amycolatopsis sp. WAC 04197]RSN45193.1 chlorophyllase [Amycolatopsis sp. WAC 04197]
MPHLQLPAPTPAISVKPVTLPFEGRYTDLEVKVTAPVTGSDLPIILLSHGFASSLDGYEPLADFWAAHGFVVIQPTHLDSKKVGLPAEDPRRKALWRFRVEDDKHVLDHLDRLEQAVPGLAGRADRNRIAVAGHSFGGQTAGILLGLHVTDAETGKAEDLSDARVKAGVLLATAGRGGDALTPFAAEHLPWLREVDFGKLTTRTVVFAGDQDHSAALTNRGASWTTDPYFLSPGAESLITLVGAEHFLGGISGYDVTETTDENPEYVALVQRASWAYLRKALGIEEDSWNAIQEDLAESPLAHIESK